MLSIRMETEFYQEFERQVTNLLEKGYPRIAHVTEKEFIQLLQPLKEQAAKLDVPKTNLDAGKLSFVIVVKSDLIAAEDAMALVEREGISGFTKLYPHEPKDFNVIEAISIPKSSVYLIVDIDRGKEYLNIRPEDALKQIQKKKRIPLTIEEGIAIVTHFPDVLKKNNCFSLLASRVAGNKRVPAIWINSKKQPNLGWCWDGNPHTWLGSASARERIGI